MRRLAWVGLALLAAGTFGCARASESSLKDVVDGKTHPDEYVQATVIEVRTASSAVYVDLSDGGTDIWVSGFTKAPARGTKVWTAFKGAPVTNDLVGTLYPTVGSLPAPDKGLTDTGTLAVLVGVVAVLALVVPATAGALLGRKPTRRCRACGGSLDAKWLTCPTCGAGSGIEPEAAPVATGATVISSRRSEEEATAQMPTTSNRGVSTEPAPSDGAPPSAGTRIFRRDD